MARLTVEIPDKLHRDLKVAAIERKTTVKRLTTDAIYSEILRESTQSTGASVCGTDGGHLRQGSRQHIGDGLDPVSQGSDSGEGG
jgi:hypothetical protein